MLGTRYLVRAALRRQCQHHTQTAANAVGQSDPTAVCLDDLARERQAKAAAGPLRRIEREQRIRQHGLTHAGAAISDLYTLVACALIDLDFDSGRRSA